MAFPKEIQELSDTFSSLPGIGPKLSNRLALYLSVNAKNLSLKLSKVLLDAADKIKSCSICGNVTNKSICEVCMNEKRNKKLIFVVEDALDLAGLESIGEYTGVYHVLGGVISPLNGISPSELNVEKLLQRIKEDEVEEVILGLNPNVEGEATSMYLKSEIDKLALNVKVSKLARGIPAGSDLEFISGQTIMDSLNSRVSY